MSGHDASRYRAAVQLGICGYCFKRAAIRNTSRCWRCKRKHHEYRARKRKARLKREKRERQEAIARNIARYEASRP